MKVEDYEEMFGTYYPKWYKDEYYKYQQDGGTMMFFEWLIWLKEQEQNEGTTGVLESE